MKRTRNESRLRRRLRHRKKIVGTPERPRLAIHRSLRHIYAQVIDDTVGQTIAAATTATKDNVRDGRANFTNREFAKALGAEIAAKAREKGVTRVVFDCGGGIYHGAVKTFADAAREAGLEF